MHYTYKSLYDLESKQPKDGFVDGDVINGFTVHINDEKRAIYFSKDGNKNIHKPFPDYPSVYDSEDIKDYDMSVVSPEDEYYYYYPCHINQLDKYVYKHGDILQPWRPHRYVSAIIVYVYNGIAKFIPNPNLGMGSLNVTLEITQSLNDVIQYFGPTFKKLIDDYADFELPSHDVYMNKLFSHVKELFGFQKVDIDCNNVILNYEDDEIILHQNNVGLVMCYNAKPEDIANFIDEVAFEYANYSDEEYSE